MTKKNQITGSSTPRTRNASKDEVDWLKSLMMAVIIVLFIGFAGIFVAVGQMMVDSLRNKQASYQSLQDKITAQNGKIDVLTKALQDEQKTIQKTN